MAPLDFGLNLNEAEACFVFRFQPEAEGPRAAVVLLVQPLRPQRVLPVRRRRRRPHVRLHVAL